ncbi:uncharacterized protein LOC110458143 [Mizuhopecten yessoensis]|uniref:uncharacterized protein LOC110458143 n=1 Tax=Mizuhopecten yessoensis TaxID=6573 RepID=UPI000B457366|nr:uncharacterized protein LOC110458143 [Mizuhopecten yessoensis]
MIVFVDENISGQRRRRRLDKKVKRACDPIDKSPRVEFTSRSFIRPTSIKQGGLLKNRTTGRNGTLGMVARAQDRREQVDEQETVVALTSGHYFKEGDIAVGYLGAQNETETDLGPCIASLLGSTDVAVIKISESDTYSFNFCDENDKRCNCVPLKHEMKMHDIVYKRGSISGLTKGYILSPDFQVNNSENTGRQGEPQKGFLIEGANRTAFAVQGDSGSVVFSPDLGDMEKETVQLVSIQSSTIELRAGQMRFEQKFSFAVRADRCFEMLRDEKEIEMNIPTKQDMD